MTDELKPQEQERQPEIKPSLDRDFPFVKVPESIKGPEIGESVVEHPEMATDFASGEIEISNSDKVQKGPLEVEVPVPKARDATAPAAANPEINELLQGKGSIHKVEEEMAEGKLDASSAVQRLNDFLKEIREHDSQ